MGRAFLFPVPPPIHRSVWSAAVHGLVHQPDDHQKGDGCAPNQWRLYCRHLHTGLPHRDPPSADGVRGQMPGQASAEECDRVVAELRYRNIRVPESLDISWTRRIQNLFLSMYRMGHSVVSAVVSVPGILNRARKMSLTEWRDTLSSWWATIKHEGAHYWVRSTRCD
jgi:hypothetical protein